jgi:hypothetical protein
MARALNTEMINIDLEADSLPWSAMLQFDADAYRAYRSAYIKQDDSPELPFWRIVGEAVSEAIRSRGGD